MFKRKTDRKKPTIAQLRAARLAAVKAIKEHKNPSKLMSIFEDSGYQVNGSFKKQNAEQ